MGNDGGSIPKRRELVKEAARALTTTDVKEVQQEQQAYLWTTCPLSLESLVEPVVSDSAGVLYNKQAVLEYLLPSDDVDAEKAKVEQAKILQSRIAGLKDVVEVKFESRDGSKDETSRWVCPVTSKMLGPGTKAVYLVPCGHAYSESAIKEISAEACLQCNTPYKQDDVIPILPILSVDKERLRARIEGLKEQGLTHSLKNASSSGKKRKKPVQAEINSTIPSLVQSDKEHVTNAGPTVARNAKVDSRNIGNTDTASLVSKVLAEEQEKAKRRKVMGNGNLDSLFSNSKDRRPDADFMTRGYSIPAGSKR